MQRKKKEKKRAKKKRLAIVFHSSIDRQTGNLAVANPFPAHTNTTVYSVCATTCNTVQRHHTLPRRNHPRNPMYPYSIAPAKKKKPISLSLGACMGISA